jgi:hypothetical protein
MSTVKGDTITAVDLTQVIMVNTGVENKKSNLFSNDDLAYQNARRNRKVRKLDFEVR